MVPQTGISLERSWRIERIGPGLPTIIYDVRNRLLEFAGGGYTIPDEGIAN